MLTQYNLKMPHAVYGGENAMDNITAIIKARGAKKVAMFTDKGIEGAGLFALPEEAVKASGAEYYVLDELPPDGEQIDRFLQSKLHGRFPEDKEKKRLTDALLRRGFSWGEVRSAWGRYGSEIWEE